MDGVAFIWIRLHLLWLGESEHKLPDVSESNTAMDTAWSQLDTDLSSVDSKTRASPWFMRELPLLSAPEYGLSEKRQIELIRALHGDVPQMIPQVWRNSRMRAVRAGKRFPRGQEPDDLFEVFTDYQDSSVSEEDRATTLLGGIRTAFPNSPWVPGVTVDDAVEGTRRRRK